MHQLTNLCPKYRVRLTSLSVCSIIGDSLRVRGKTGIFLYDSCKKTIHWDPVLSDADLSVSGQITLTWFRVCLSFFVNSKNDPTSKYLFIKYSKAIGGMKVLPVAFKLVSDPAIFPPHSLRSS